MTGANTIIADMQLVETNLRQQIAHLNDEIAGLKSDVAYVKHQQWIIANGVAELAIERCKNATGQSRTINLYVDPVICANDVLEAIDYAKGIVK